MKKNGDQINQITFEKRSNGPGDSRRLTPPTNAARDLPPLDAPSPSRRCKHACRSATSDEEQAVSTVILGPTVPRVKESRFASMDAAAPVLLEKKTRRRENNGAGGGAVVVNESCLQVNASGEHV